MELIEIAVNSLKEEYIVIPIMDTHILVGATVVECCSGRPEN